MLALKPPGTQYKYLDAIMHLKRNQWNACFDASICYRTTYRGKKKASIQVYLVRFL